MLKWSGCVDISCYADFIDGSAGRTLAELQKFENGPKSRLIRRIRRDRPMFAIFAVKREIFRLGARGPRTLEGRNPAKWWRGKWKSARHRCVAQCFVCVGPIEPG